MDRAGNPENIVFVEGVICGDDLRDLRSYCDSIKSWSSDSYDGSNDKIHHITSFSEPCLLSLKAAVNHIQWMIEERFGRELCEQHPNVRKWEVGDYQPLHADGEDTKGNPNEAYPVDYASIIYINDNYSGGEIEFPLQNKKWKPVAGTAVFFPANKWFAHAVLEITEGVRYTSPQFWMPTKHVKLRDFYVSR